MALLRATRHEALPSRRAARRLAADARVADGQKADRRDGKPRSGHSAQLERDPDWWPVDHGPWAYGRVAVARRERGEPRRANAGRRSRTRGESEGKRIGGGR